MNTENEQSIILAALRHLEKSVQTGDNLSYLQDIATLDLLQNFDISALCEKINCADSSNKLVVRPINDGNNPDAIVLEAEQTGDPGIYQEVALSALQGKDCVAFIIVGLDCNNELRVSLTSDGNGDGDHAIAVFPCRDIESSIELNK